MAATSSTTPGSGPSFFEAVNLGNEEAVRAFPKTEGPIKELTEFGNTALHKTAAKGNGSMARLLIELGADLKAQNQSGSTPMHKAVLKANEEVFQILFDHDASGARISDSGGKTPLHLIAMRGHEQMLQCVLKGKEVNLAPVDLFGRTPLHVAIVHNQSEVASSLIQLKAGIDLADKDGQTPIHMAIRYKRMDALRLLVEHGAALQQEFLTFACIWGNVEAIEFLLDVGLKPDAPSIRYATLNGDIRAVKAFINADADMSQPLGKRFDEGYDNWVAFCKEAGKDWAGTGLVSGNFTALHIASIMGNSDLVALLIVEYTINSSEKLEVRDSVGRTPLFYAISGGDSKVFELLVNAGADVFAKDHQKTTLLHIAATYGRVATCKYLLKRGIFVDVLSKNRWTPLLHLTANLRLSKIDELESRLRLTKLLLDHGANPNAVGMKKFRKGTTSLHEICHNMRMKKENKEFIDCAVEAIQLLKNYKADPGIRVDENHSPLIEAVQSDVGNAVFHLLKDHEHLLKEEKPKLLFRAVRSAGMLETLQKLGADLTATFEEGNSLLHLYIERQEPEELIRKAVSFGVDPNSKTEKGFTPLHLCGMWDKPKGAEVLLDCGADINQQDKHGYTPLHWAVQEQSKDMAVMLTTQKMHRINLNLEDENGLTPLHRAASVGNVEIAKLLIEAGADPRKKNSKGQLPGAFVEEGNRELRRILPKF